MARDIQIHSRTDSASKREAHYSSEGNTPYVDTLKQTRGKVLEMIGRETNNEGKAVDITTILEDSLKNMIKGVIIDNNIKCSNPKDLNSLVNYIYHDMARLSFISRDNLIEDDSFEELNIDAWNSVWIKKSGGVYKKSDYTFLSPEHLKNVLGKMLKQAKEPFNEGMPYITTSISESVRLTAYTTPVVDPNIGAVVSIRKISTSIVDRERLLQGTITEEMLDFLLSSAKYGISQCYAGETGSGKTTLTGFVIKECAKNMRVFTIEEGAREWDFYVNDSNGDVLNSIVHTKTKKDNEKDRNIDQNQLLQGALRFDPDLIGVGEMRSDEAFAAIEASNTGHPVITTVHSSSASDSPVRLMTLAKKAFEFQDNTLMNMIVDAFPLQIYMRLFPDGSRRVTEIVEIRGYRNGELEYTPIYKFVVHDNKKDENGKLVEVQGEFQKFNAISDKLKERMLFKGATKEEIDKFSQIGVKQ